MKYYIGKKVGEWTIIEEAERVKTRTHSRLSYLCQNEQGETRKFMYDRLEYMERHKPKVKATRKTPSGYVIGANSNKGKDSTLCWDCKKSSGHCSWSARYVPVKGWEAEPTVINNGNTDYVKLTPSFRVISCPKFERLLKRPEQPEHIHKTLKGKFYGKYNECKTEV